jgi:hypothetical protein
MMIIISQKMIIIIVTAVETSNLTYIEEVPFMAEIRTTAGTSVILMSFNYSSLHGVLRLKTLLSHEQITLILQVK